MRLFIVILFFTAFFSAKTSAGIRQQADSILERRGEVVVRFEVSGKNVVNELTREMSISHIKGNTVTAYLNKTEFSIFLEKKIPYILVFPAKTTTIKQKSTHNPWNWDSYPTYKQYLSMMDSFAKAYPSICKLEEFGKSVKGKKILALKISDSVSIHQNEKELLYTSTMHGNETTGFILMLRLIDYILKHYQSDANIRNLVDNLQIYINPVSNPDGLFKFNDSITYESTRNNEEEIDLNRNFPDPIAGSLPNGYNKRAVENIAMMDFLDKHQFVLSANLHDGAEVINYPWDTYSSDKSSIFNKPHPEQSFFIEISKKYADTANYYASKSYFRTLNNTGYIQGNEWYVVYGGRQDYVTYFLGGKEVTIELSNSDGTVSITPDNMLNNYWNYNYRSLINFMKTAITTNIGIKNSISKHSVISNNDINFINKGNNLVFNLKSTFHGNYEIEFINTIGKIEYTTKVYLENEVQISIPRALKGLYIVKVKNKHSHLVKKLYFIE